MLSDALRDVFDLPVCDVTAAFCSALFRFRSWEIGAGLTLRMLEQSCSCEEQYIVDTYPKCHE